MKTLVRNTALPVLAIACVLVLGNKPAEAFWGHHRVTTAYALPSVPVAVGYAPVVVAAPVVAASPIIVGSPVVTAGYAPITTAYAAPATYVAPAPITTYYAPAPVTTYYAPAPVMPFYAPRAGVIVRRPVLLVP